MRAVNLWWMLGALAGLGCSDCATEGCDSLREHAGGRDSGIAGIVAETSDVISDGCQECPFSDASIRLWSIATPVGTQAEVQALFNTPEDHRFDVHERYREALAPGAYLLCESSTCINISAVDGATTTVNIKKRYGPTSFFVAGPTGALAEDRGLQVELGF